MNVYIGYDPREDKAYEVAVRSIWKHTPAADVKPIELVKMKGRGLLTREIEFRDGKMWCPISQAPMATEFAISRFCVPFLQTSGWALFADCDILCRKGLDLLFGLADPAFAVMVVKHKQESGPDTKMDGQAQVYYARKNWSSVVLWNCAHPANERLTREALNTWPGRDLHAFKWLDDHQIGELPPMWNHLVGISKDDPMEAGILHYTMGGPWIKGWKGGPLDDLWIMETN